MKANDEKNQKPHKPARKRTVKPETKATSDENSSSELSKPRWSVVSFEKCLASSLTYEQAARKLEGYGAKKVSGLCIITDEAAEKIAVKK